jgi:WhiB family transcriptional regulator, redox-sensing transcriptional regulator
MPASYDISWMRAGRCRDLPPDMFFPTNGQGVVAAQRICSTCPVQRACLEFALAKRIHHGVWGGTSERERRRLLGQRGARTASPGDGRPAMHLAARYRDLVGNAGNSLLERTGGRDRMAATTETGPDWQFDHDVGRAGFEAESIISRGRPSRGYGQTDTAVDAGGSSSRHDSQRSSTEP